MSLELKTELFMTLKDYEPEGLERLGSRLDITALDDESDDRILLRVITKSKSESGRVGMGTAQKMVEAIQSDGYDKVILIGESFTEAARRKLIEEGIQTVSEDFLLNFEPKRLYLAVKELVDDVCKTKCGEIPKKESDCKGYSNRHYSCRARLVSDNAWYHFERGWKKLLQEDVLRVLSLQRSLSS